MTVDILIVFAKADSPERYASMILVTKICVTMEALVTFLPTDTHVLALMDTLATCVKMTLVTKETVNFVTVTEYASLIFRATLAIVIQDLAAINAKRLPAQQIHV